MFLVPNNWQPSSSLETMRLRAEMLAQLREFFTNRNVLEVETPLLSRHTVTDVHIDSFGVNCGKDTDYYLQTSPEYAMKRLLASGSGDIYQICKVFRRGEAGGRHNPEFSMLEWYRAGFDHHMLMQELAELLKVLLDCKAATKLSYCEIFKKYLDIDPLNAELGHLHALIDQHGIKISNALTNSDIDTCLQLLFSHLIEPKLGYEAPCFIFDFPASQAALAKLNEKNALVAERFELFINGMELANGFCELTDANQQQQRFLRDQALRRSGEQPIPEIDERLIAALKHGLPSCAGVAIGLDRILMLKAGITNIEAVINFPWHIA